nr:hypothetical protein Iba_chr01cCG2150 [Ipomoea batatas]
MLVTKKSKPGDTVKNTRHPIKDSNISTANRGNQYSLLADAQEDSEPTVHRQQTDKNKSKAIPRQTSKAPAPPQPRTPHPAPVTTPPANPPTHNPHSNSPTHNTRSRGGHSAANRGRGRGLGRGHNPSHDSPQPHSMFTGSWWPSIVFYYGRYSYYLG